MAQMIVVQGQNPATPWSHGVCDCCVNPGTCIYALCCPNCAAGEIAQAAGRDYCISCCVLPFLCPPVALCCWTCSDREELIRRYNVQDSVGKCGSCALAYFVPCGVACVLTQQLDHIRSGAGKGGATTIVVQQQQPQYGAPPPQQYQGAPQQYGAPPPQQYAPSQTPQMYGAPPAPAPGGYPQQQQLPPGWVATTDPSTGKQYFANPQTGATSWTFPTQ